MGAGVGLTMSGFVAAIIPHVEFTPARGLHSPHSQTVYASVLRKPRFPAALRRERWDTPDGDFIDVEVLDAPAGAPRVLLLHGLEGSSDSGYIRQSLRLIAARGWGAYALNFRGCSGEPNRTARSYCSGDYDDPLFVLSRFPPRVPRYAMGFSLGGNVLLKMLAERHDQARVDAAVAVSVPFDLAQCARILDGPERWMRFYQWRFLRTLKAKALEKAPRFPRQFDVARIGAAQSIIAFDDCATAPLYGLKNAADYYAWASSGPRLGAIRTRTLLISSEDDPMAPASMLPKLDNPQLHGLITLRGGHVAFVAGSLWRPTFWAEERAFDFFSSGPASAARDRSAG
jgi:predicted alpha/beta-fold hydrolase